MPTSTDWVSVASVAPLPTSVWRLPLRLVIVFVHVSPARHGVKVLFSSNALDVALVSPELEATSV